MGRTRTLSDETSPLAPTRLSPALAVTGLLMLAAVFLLANPWFGVTETAWPWETLVHGVAGPLVKVVFVAWLITAFWCLLTAFTEARRIRAVGACALAAVLLVECSGPEAGFTISDYNLKAMLPMIALGAGLLLAREHGSRGLGRALAGLGGVFLFWSLASSFPAEGPDAQLGTYVTEMRALLSDLGHEFPGKANHVWWSLIPQTLIVLAALCGLLAALGVAARRFLLIGFLLLLLGLVMPLGVGVVLQLGEGVGARQVTSQITDNLVGHGLLLWMLSVFALRDLGLLRAEAA